MFKNQDQDNNYFSITKMLQEKQHQKKGKTQQRLQPNTTVSNQTHVQGSQYQYYFTEG